MISLQDLKKWLNHFDTSSLGLQSREYLDQAADDQTPSVTRHVVLEKLLEHARASLKPLEYAEASFMAGIIFMQKEGDCRHAQAAFERALEGFAGDEHRRAVALWAAGMMERKNLQPGAGYRSWQMAYEIFDSIANRHKLAGQAERLQLAPWYRERADRMQKEIALTAEYGYTLLDRFEPSPLDEISKALVRKAIQLTDRQQYASAYAVLGQVRKHSRLAGDYLNTPAGLLECGLVCYQAGFQEAACEFLREAIEKYPPLSHRQAAASWMYGCMLAGDVDHLGEIDLALSALKKALEIFAYLEKRSTEQNLNKKMSWYTQQRKLLEAAYQAAVRDWISSVEG
ncbi:MAG: hypothetical protein GYA48_05465 [Chloroflexi bacterium]|nr:hypothetical protein [Chloroflexota bacterium]